MIQPVDYEPSDSVSNLQDFMISVFICHLCLSVGFLLGGCIMRVKCRKKYM